MKVKTIKDIRKDSRIADFIHNYDGRGRHFVECKEGFRFEGETTCAIGSVKEICEDINERLEHNGQYRTW